MCTLERIDGNSKLQLSAASQMPWSCKLYALGFELRSFVLIAAAGSTTPTPTPNSPRPICMVVRFLFVCHPTQFLCARIPSLESHLLKITSQVAILGCMSLNVLNKHSHTGALLNSSWWCTVIKGVSTVQSFCLVHSTAVKITTLRRIHIRIMQVLGRCAYCKCRWLNGRYWAHCKC